jgi:transcription factor E2F7/8
MELFQQYLKQQQQQQQQQGAPAVMPASGFGTLPELPLLNPQQQQAQMQQFFAQMPQMPQQQQQPYQQQPPFQPVPQPAAAGRATKNPGAAASSAAAAAAASAAPSAPPAAAATGAGGAAAPKAYSRKDKSLGLLCENFLALYARDALAGAAGGGGAAAAYPQICLDGTAATLGVERRRIYDIVNILEAVDVVSRRGKNQYVWYGVTRLGAALRLLEAAIVSRGNGFPQTDVLGLASFGAQQAAAGAVMAPSAAASQHTQITFGGGGGGDFDDEVDEAAATKGRRGRKSATGANKNAAAADASDPRKEQSLGHLSQVFVQMFLSPLNPTRVVSLEDAGRWLLGGPVARPGQTEAQAQATFKSRVRRLYDIANVFTSLELIEKIHLSQTRKPAFKWAGAGVFPLHSSVPPEAFTFDAPHKHRTAGLAMSMAAAAAAATGGAGSAATAAAGLAALPAMKFGPAGLGAAAAAAAAAAGTGAGTGGGGAFSSMKSAHVPPMAPRRATIDTAQLASNALLESAKAAAAAAAGPMPPPPPSVASGMASSAASVSSSLAQAQQQAQLQKSFERFEQAQQRYAVHGQAKAKQEPAAATESKYAAATKAEPGIRPKLQSTLQPSLSRGALDALSAQQAALQKRSDSLVKAEETMMSHAGGGGGFPVRATSSFARPQLLSGLQSRSSSLLPPSGTGGAAIAGAGAGTGAADPLLCAYPRGAPPSSQQRMARLYDEQEEEASTAAAASSSSSSSPSRLPLVAWDGTSSSSYVRDSRSFLAHYRSVCEQWQRKHRSLFMDMEVRARLLRSASTSTHTSSSGGGVAATHNGAANYHPYNSSSNNNSRNASTLLQLGSPAAAL